MPGLARAVEEHWTTKRKDPGSTPDKGSEFSSVQRKFAHVKYNARCSKQDGNKRR